MLIKKTFKFYASHRNRNMQGKCFSVHGHRYGLTMVFQAPRDRLNPDISIPFEAFEHIDKYLKAKWDHAHIIDEGDPLLEALNSVGSKVVVLERIPSVENICFRMFWDILQLGYDLLQLEIQETDTSTVIYSRQDFETDHSEIATTAHECDFSIPGKAVCDVCGTTRFLYFSAKRAKDKSAAGKYLE